MTGNRVGPPRLTSKVKLSILKAADENTENGQTKSMPDKEKLTKSKNLKNNLVSLFFYFDKT